MSKKCQIVVIHDGTGTDIEGVYVLTGRQGYEMWRWIDREGSDPFGWINDQIEKRGEDAVLCRETLKDAFEYIKGNDLEIEHECAMGSY